MVNCFHLVTPLDWQTVFIFYVQKRNHLRENYVVN